MALASRPLPTSAPAPSPTEPRPHRSFDEPGTPLPDVTFVVVDLETTGGSPAACEITEIGAVKYRGGECLGTFQTLVNPGVPIPPFITVLTGITDAMLLPAPRIEEVLPPLLEFIGGAVLVGHNLRFDTSFLDAALVREGYGRLDNRRVDTLGLARRLLRDGVMNHKLGTLAHHFGTTIEPNHRAFDDAAATAEVLHGLIECAAAFGVFGLDDLLALPKIRVHPTATKLALTETLPRTSGLFWFRDRTGRVLYVGRAANLRSRVRSYFGGTRRGAALQLLREIATIEHVECADELEASVRELRLIRAHRPRYNRPAAPSVYLKVTLGEAFPRLTVVRSRPPDASVYLGPLPSLVWARRVKEAIETVLPLRRCTTRIATRAPVSCKCSGSVTASTYAVAVQQAVDVITGDANPLLEALATRRDDLVSTERFELAARARDGLTTLSAALDRQRRLDAIRRAGRLRIVLADTVVDVDGGRMLLDDDPAAGTSDDADAAADEVLLVARWVERVAGRVDVRLDRASGELSSQLPRRVGQTVGSRGRMRVR